MRKRYEPADKARAYEIIEQCGGNIMQAAELSGIAHSVLNSWLARDRRAGNKVPRTQPRNGSMITTKERFEMVLRAREIGFGRAAKEMNVSEAALKKWQRDFVQGRYPDYKLDDRGLYRNVGIERIRVSGLKLREMRMRKGLYSWQVASALNISGPSYSRFENDADDVPVDIFARLLEVLDITPEQVGVNKSENEVQTTT